MKLPSLALLPFVAVSLSLSSLAADQKPGLRAAAAQTDITPTEFPVNMPGNFSANIAEKAHDPLMARAMVLDDGKTKVAMAVLDTLNASQDLHDEIKAIVTEKTGIPADKILISSTHTHTGGRVGRAGGPPETVAYRNLLIKNSAEAIIRAHATLRPAAFGASSHPLPEEVHNRRWYLKPGKMPLNPFGKLDQVKMNPINSPDFLDRPAGPTDPDVTIISIQNPEKKQIALFANYSLHYVGNIPQGQISADYFGEFARLMPNYLPGDGSFVAMMSNGTSGDINNIPFGSKVPPRKPFDQVRFVAIKAADAAWYAYHKIDQHKPDVSIGMLERTVTLKYRRPTPEQVAEAKAILAVKGEEAEANLPRLAKGYASATINAANRKEDTLTVKIQAIRIGDFAVCGMPFEVFAETGLDIKKRSPYPQTMVIGLANGSTGYLPTPEQHKLGGYEAWLGSNSVQEDTTVILTNHLLDMLAELKKPQ